MGKLVGASIEEARVGRARLHATVDHHGDWGVLHIHHSSLEQLDEALQRLEKSQA
jgi:hypothetical protein